jgi:hypothetical protein
MGASADASHDSLRDRYRPRECRTIEAAQRGVSFHRALM